LASAKNLRSLGTTSFCLSFVVASIVDQEMVAMVIHVMQDMTTWLSHTTHWGDWLQQGLAWYVPHDWTVLAQQYNQDILGDIQKGFNHFVKTGQVWALLIGVILGYMIRSMTAY
jgi:hypothetical protein